MIREGLLIVSCEVACGPMKSTLRLVGPTDVKIERLINLERGAEGRIEG